jgi:hypothetical protein
VAIGHELAGARQALERIALEDRRVAGEVVEHPRLEGEEAAVDPALAGLRLLGELAHAVVLEGQRAEARRRPHGRDGRELPVRAVEAEQRACVQVREAVAVGDEERPFAEVRPQPADPAARHRLPARVDDLDPPSARERRLPVFSGSAGPAFDHLPLVPARDDELLEARARVDRHHVPEDRTAADLDHRLRPELGLLGEPGPGTAARIATFRRGPPAAGSAR